MEIVAGWDIPLHWGLLLLVVLLIYIYATWPYSQFQRLGISGPPPQPFLGNMRQMISKTTVHALKEWSQQYGRIYGLYLGREPMIVIGDIEILKSVLVKDFAHFSDRAIFARSAQARVSEKMLVSATGADWKRIRSIVTPTFSTSKLKMMEPQINRCSEVLADNLLEKIQEGQKINVKDDFGAYTLDVIASTAFGLQVNSQKDASDPFLVNIKGFFANAGKIRVYNTIATFLPVLNPVVGWLRIHPWFNKPMLFYTTNIRSMIEQRKADKNQSRSVDFLQLIINAEASDGVTSDKKRLTQDEIISQMLIFFIAGYETTAATLQYMSYNLAMHPEVQQRIVTEMQQQLGEETPTYENVTKLKYMEQTIHETLRMHPPATTITRLASETVTIKGLTIPKGFGVMIPCAEVMMDPEYFPDPQRFDPDRFSDKASVDPISFLPFGFGPRACVGTRLAMLEIKIAMVHVLRKLQFVRTPDLPETLQYSQGVDSLLNLASPLLVKAVAREADQ
ncbi:hypothetical protein ACOMHN_050110 [Nucella lapillus]